MVAKRKHTLKGASKDGEGKRYGMRKELRRESGSIGK
jgi:hypothetical protein